MKKTLCPMPSQAASSMIPCRRSPSPAMMNFTFVHLSEDLLGGVQEVLRALLHRDAAEEQHDLVASGRPAAARARLAPDSE